MSPERLAEIEEHFHAIRAAGPEHRNKLLDALHPDIRRNIDALLANDGISGLIDRSPFSRDQERTVTAPTPGTMLGPYRIEGELGAGGMGTVFRATDTRLGRSVALKITHERFSDRFEREARAISALNHPHVCTLHDVGPNFLVMELVEGETLAARLKRGPLPLEQALAYGSQIARAMAAAHAKGIVHRDLKPGNIMLTKSGVKVLDFGLSKSAADVTLTDTRAVMGTPAYMSPEQREGRETDHRTDIYSFGLVLAEMVTGKRSADGIEHPQLAHIVERCVAHDAAARWQSAADISFELEWLDQVRRAPAPTGPASHGKWPRYTIPALLAATVLAGGTWFAIWKYSSATPAALPIRTNIVLPPRLEVIGGVNGSMPLALSPDGSRLAYVAEDGGRRQLYLRALDDLVPKTLPGASGADHPFFSPDGNWLAYFASGGLHKVAIAGGAPLRICDVNGSIEGGSWGPGDIIVVAERGTGRLLRVPASGGACVPLGGVTSAEWPDFLPDGRTILFTYRREAIATVPLSGGKIHIVAQISNAHENGPAILGAGLPAQARFVSGLDRSTGYLIYGQSPSIMRAALFNPDKGAVESSVISLPGMVERGPGSGGVFFALSRAGTLVYIPTGDRHQLVWVDRRGVETPISADRAAFRLPKLSPDGKRLAVAVNDETRRSDLWLYDVASGARNRLTSASHNLSPIWSPDGKRLVMTRDGGLWEMPLQADGEAQRRQLVKAPAIYATAWSPDGQTLLYEQDSPEGFRVQMLTTHGENRVLLGHPFVHSHGVFSPDGKWIAWVSNESGIDRIYAARFPDLDRKVVISGEGGTNPRWARGGREIIYRQGDAVVSSEVVLSPEPKVVKTEVLFQGHYSGAGHDSDFDVTPDGQRFVMVKSDEAATLGQIIVVQNWLSELKELRAR